MEEKSSTSVLNENVEKYVETILESVVGEVAYGFSTMAEEVDSVPEKAEEDSDPEMVGEETGTEDEGKEEMQTSEADDAAARVFEERQKLFLIGRRVSADIINDDGQILVKENTVIDEQVMNIVKAHGKMVDLIMNNGK